MGQRFVAIRGRIEEGRLVKIKPENIRTS